ncbi:hypothetical protein PL75_03550 [Neisseria arctica]|uniref:Lipoprotein n=1 Tax=Neisseria arctica TaxID=1470200 RepID=A0A0J1C4R3_9NEIS|nr:hypothetical protein [Neisseria arctica]KLT73303.1 hypothetical protein PL75_03550 [Neisseria arctica]UOO87434.1 hypothetical protein LVJ86_04090 [Neisseria arctica]
MRYAALTFVLLLGACASWQGKEYAVGAYTASGQPVNKHFKINSNKAGIEVARDSLCKVYPNAIIRVYNNITRQEVVEYSPYSCRTRR